LRDDLYLDNHIIETDIKNNVTKEYCGFGDGRIEFTSSGATDRFYLKDHLGSTRAVINGEGALIVAVSYDAYGAIIRSEILAGHYYGIMFGCFKTDKFPYRIKLLCTFGEASMDECIRVIKSIFVVFTIISIWGCREMGQNPLILRNAKIETIQLLHEERILATFSDTTKISQFISFVVDSISVTNNDFKSFDFIKFIDKNGKSYRIEVFEKMFRFKGKRYILNSEIMQKFYEYFKK